MSFIADNMLVTGANGVVGAPLCNRLAELGALFKVVSRNAGENLIQWDLETPVSAEILNSLGSLTTLIHCAPLWLLPNNLEPLKSLGLKRVIAFSSSSVISKLNSTDSTENHLVQQLSKAEAALNSYCEQNDIVLTIFRPSMIYGYGRDQNVSHLAGFIGRYKLIVLVGHADGLRQPVHADDLVDACLLALDKPASYGNTYNLAGAETLTYRAMVERIFNGLKLKPRIISLPLKLYRLALRTAAFFGRFSYTPEMANRMNQNLNYDCMDAVNDFAYSPQTFLAQPERDLPSR